MRSVNPSRPIRIDAFDVNAISQAVEFHPELQKPRYVLASSSMWVFFFFLKLFEDYDGIMSWMGAFMVATFLLVITLPVLLLLGLIRRFPGFARIWYSDAKLAAAVFIVSGGILVFGNSLGMREASTYTNSLGEIVTGTRLYLGVSLPVFLLAAFSVLYWPRRSSAAS